MNRIVERFARLKREHRKGFIVYIGAGDPSLEATRQLALAFDKLGVDVLELGVPFSDPLADGLVNQLAAQRGLESGTTPPKVLETVAAIRRDSQIPIVLYIYFNLIHRRGVEQFIRDAARAGVDGLLVLDLPPEESDNYEALMRQAGLCHIYLVAPTTPEDRIELIVKRGAGFIYYVSREGVTGMQTRVADTIAQHDREDSRPHGPAHRGRLRHLHARASEDRGRERRGGGGGQRHREPDRATRQNARFDPAGQRVCEAAPGSRQEAMKAKPDNTERFVIIMAGGRGERFWPVSREKTAQATHHAAGRPVLSPAGG